MDEYTWRKKLNARRRRRKMERLFVLFMIICALSGVIWYFTSYKKTPAYAMNEFSALIHTNDAAKINRYVDLPTLTARTYDDLTGDLFKYDTQLSINDRLLFENFYVLIRRQMCQGAVDVINRRIETGEWTLPGGILKGRQLGIDFDLLLERSLIRHTSILGVENVEHHGDSATAEIKIQEDYTQTPFTLQVTLENFGEVSWQIGSAEFEFLGKSFKFPGLSFTLDDNGWKIVSLDNYKDYLDLVAPILQVELESYIDETASIIYDYNNLFEAEQNEFIVMQRTPSGFMNYEQRRQIVDYISQTIIPTLEGRQVELNKVAIPKGARYLANLRKESTETTIQAWRFYAQGVIDGDAASFAAAESVHKQELALDQRIDEIVKNSAVTRNLPDLP